MRTINRKILVIIAIGAVFASFSCAKDFLEVNPSQETPEVALSDPDVAPQLVNAIYNQFLGFNMSSFPWYGATEITSDNADKGSDPGDTGTYQKNHADYTYTETEASFRLLWENHYQGIARANRAIILLPDVDIEEDLKNRLIGEARFLRGLMYFRMVQMFGGVPLIDFIPDPNSEEDINRAYQRASVEELYDFIEADLMFAINNLPLKSEYAPADLGRAPKGAALALMSKVKLYQEEWQAAYDYSLEVINSGEYQLEPNYEDIWKDEFENGVESIFEIQGRGELPTLGVGNYSTSQGARGQGGWGWGFNSPSEDLVNTYEEGDERMDGTIIFQGETLYDGRFVPETVTNERYNQKAYTNINAQSNAEKNVRLIRYGEVLLINAEAAFELGNTGIALERVNQIRDRAGLEDLESLTVLDIYKERRLELAMEGDRIFDLRRQGRAAEVMQAFGVPFVENKHELFPIPQEQIAQSGGLLEQNPGW
ncbi:RagB/SusD family nutrient uptake outer membrane protein [Pontixanthobacter gangjinensis]|uniref:RagB/SusD family nutrient uptake outer membrane protein n=1 Tax=Christiangramia aestuarii TaxID=1028746 RepID=A0A7K1LMA9_9FLAO|nr:RagB/SusD family nutrient uptake outer membrane protein [Christiangramia aestuarii]MUP41946.1 RagB/SusD family nutrient uptake outer membrane protein [Christiangramia aestuarii]